MTYEMTAFVCSHVFAASRSVLLVARENGDWMYLCGEVHAEDEPYHVVGAEHLLSRDPSLRQVADLPDNSEAERAGIGMPWTRRPLSAE